MMNQILFAGVIGLFLTLIGTPPADQAPGPQGLRAVHPRRRTARARQQARYADHGRHRVHPGHGRRLLPVQGDHRQTPPTYSGLLVLGLMVGMGMVGFLDDYIKIVKRRSLGLRAKAKMAGQLIVGIAFAVLSLQFSDNRGNTPPASTKLSFITDFGWTIGRCCSWSGRCS